MLFQLWYLEQQAFKIFVCHREKKVCVTADNSDCQTSLPKGNREMMR